MPKKKIIETFTDYLSIVPLQVAVGDKNKAIDKIMDSIHGQKEHQDPDAIMGLQVRLTASHAARLTGHYHYYQPNKVRDSVESFVKPFGKPFLAHHKTEQDAIGRVVKATYVSTPHLDISKSIIASAYADATHGNHKKKKKHPHLNYVDKLKPFLFDKTFEGLGYISLLTNITDEEAIKKVIDGRYLTVSIGYDTNHLHCSIDLQDWIDEGPCEHEKGQMYNDEVMFFIFGDMEYGEVSYVNEPADDLAQNNEIKRVMIPSMELKDSKEIKKILVNNEAVYDDISRIAEVNQSFFLIDSITNDLTPIFSDLNQNNQSGEIMKIIDLTSLSMTDFYEKITPFLDEDDILTEEDLQKHEDKDFAFAGKTFPAFDMKHIDACKKILEAVEDSEAKTEMEGFLETRITALKAKEITDDANVNAESKESDEAKGAGKKEGADKDDNKKDSSDKASDADTEVKADYLTYSFKLEAGNWGVPDGEEKSTVYEKAILDLLMAMYSKETEDAKSNIDKIFKAVGTEKKDELIQLIALEQIKALEDSLTSVRNEFTVAQDAVKTSQVALAKMSDELKEHTIDQILTFQDREDPDKSPDEQRVFFKDKSLSELRTSLQTLQIIKGSDGSVKDLENLSSEDNPTHTHDKSFVKPEEIEKLRKQIDISTEKMRSELGDEVAQRYLDNQTQKLNKLIASNKQIVIDKENN